MKQLAITIISILTFICLILCGCKRSDITPDYGREVIESGSYPQAIKVGEFYYFIMPDSRPGHISLRKTDKIENLGAGEPITVYKTTDSNMQHIWSPEIHHIKNKWYIYFEADDGNTDNHHLYVLENISPDPTTGVWNLHGPILTNEDWNYGIHPSTFAIGDRRYLIWSGWEKRRTETETQCIFIAEMENPWTLKSERVLISRPEYEWERQWINPDVTRSAYPIFVNENPEAYISPDKKTVIITYSASGIWTRYSTLGLLRASTDSDILNPKSWKKSAEPVFVPREESPYSGSSNVCLLPSPDGKETLMLFHVKPNDRTIHSDHDRVLIKAITWDGDTMPEFGSY